MTRRPATHGSSSARGVQDVVEVGVHGCGVGLDRRRRNTREERRLAISTWIERTYHRRRRQRHLGRLTPVEYETLDLAANAV